MNDELIVSAIHGVGRLRLNRPKAIHALTRDICAAMGKALLEWASDPSIRLVTIDHAEGRGFCAGGDIRALWESGRTDGVEACAFFHEEYRLNHLLYTYPKPIAAFMDGITMGGGVGITQAARFRIATERTVFAMPETGIGLFPDVGGGWYLSRLAGNMGRYLAMTGARADSGDCVALGLATHYVPSEKLAALKTALEAEPDDVARLVDDAAEAAPASFLFEKRDAIERLFAAATAEGIVAALDADGSDFARATLATIATKSPQTVKVSLRELDTSLTLPDFAAEMAMEYRIASRVCRMHDFLEGVRAVIVDKTNDPDWRPARLPEVSDAVLDAIFAPLSAADEWTPYPVLQRHDHDRSVAARMCDGARR